jgi:hypothetical protein
MYSQFADQIIDAFEACADKDTVRKQPAYIIRSMFMEELQDKLKINPAKALAILRDIEIDVNTEAMEEIGVVKMRKLVDCIVAVIKVYNEAHVEDFGTECYSVPGLILGLLFRTRNKKEDPYAYS